MGRSIGGQLALKGAEISLYDHSEYGRVRAIEILRAELRDLVNDGCLRASDEQDALNRVDARTALEVDPRTGPCGGDSGRHGE